MSDERIRAREKLNLVDEVFQAGPDTLEKIKAATAARSGDAFVASRRTRAASCDPRRTAVGQIALWARAARCPSIPARTSPRSEDHLRQLVTSLARMEDW
jgi:hypothetical protein